MFRSTLRSLLEELYQNLLEYSGDEDPADEGEAGADGSTGLEQGHLAEDVLQTGDSLSSFNLCSAVPASTDEVLCLCREARR